MWFECKDQKMKKLWFSSGNIFVTSKPKIIDCKSPPTHYIIYNKYNKSNEFVTNVQAIQLHDIALLNTESLTIFTPVMFERLSQ